jgi:hypothetical protein
MYVCVCVCVCCTQPVLLPPRTRLVGAGTELTAIYFEEATPKTAPYAYFALAPSNSTAPERRVASGVTATSWGVTDLTVFITAFHNIVFDAANITDGWWLQRVRVRANAWFAQVRACDMARVTWRV